MTTQILDEKKSTDNRSESQFNASLADIVIRRWMIAGCFDGGLDEVILPEDKINPNGCWKVSDSDVCWRDATIGCENKERSDQGEIAGRLMFDNQKGDVNIKNASIPVDDYITGSSGIVYFATYIYSRRKSDYLFNIQYPSDYKIIQNGDIVCKGRDNQTVELTLRHGWNLFVVKANYSNQAQFYGGLSDSEGNPFADGWVKSGFMEGDDIDTQLFGKNPDDKEQAIEIGSVADEYQRTNPDSVVYIPKEGDFNDGDNEHFLVFNSPQGDELLAMWTQGSMEPSGDNHIMLARSSDGVKWSQPLWITGTQKGTDQTQASWGFPVVAKNTGRIYCFYCKSPAGKLGGASGILGCHISDDNGYNWKECGHILFPDCFGDVSDINTQNGGIIVWQKTIRDSKGRQIVGYSFCGKGEREGCCRFMRFDNIDDGPDVEDIKITWLSLEGDTISMPKDLPARHCSEPAVELLPDGRLFVVFRTVTGFVWYSVSDDDGLHWQKPQVLRYCDDGEPVKNPLTCCPLYRLENGRYILIHYNNNYYADYMEKDKELPAGMSMFTHRRPAVCSLGRFVRDADQPLWFDKPDEILDTGGVLVSPKASNEVATYPSITYFKGNLTLWYPDRKFFLLGKHLEF